jgi:hypothetical protein
MEYRKLEPTGSSTGEARGIPGDQSDCIFTAAASFELSNFGCMHIQKPGCSCCPARSIFAETYK